VWENRYGRMGVGEWVWEDGCDGRMGGHGRMGMGEWVGGRMHAPFGRILEPQPKNGHPSLPGPTPCAWAHVA